LIPRVSKRVKIWWENGTPPSTHSSPHSALRPHRNLASWISAALGVRVFVVASGVQTAVPIGICAGTVIVPVK
jgi:hypothetical protein